MFFLKECVMKSVCNLIYKAKSYHLNTLVTLKAYKISRLREQLEKEEAALQRYITLPKIEYRV